LQYSVFSAGRVSALTFELRYVFAMTLEFVQHNWAVLVASVLGLGIGLFVAYRVFDDSARGRLMHLVRLYDEKILAANKAQRVASKADAKLQKLRAKLQSAKPRHVQEMSEALEDAHALLKIAKDQVLIAANHLRKLILEEFPPARHEQLQSKYLPDTSPDKKPFTF
jgi:hypothetical protein